MTLIHAPLPFAQIPPSAIGVPHTPLTSIEHLAAPQVALDTFSQHCVMIAPVQACTATERRWKGSPASRLPYAAFSACFALVIVYARIDTQQLCMPAPTPLIKSPCHALHELVFVSKTSMRHSTCTRIINILHWGVNIHINIHTHRFVHTYLFTCTYACMRIYIVHAMRCSRYIFSQPCSCVIYPGGGTLDIRFHLRRGRWLYIYRTAYFFLCDCTTHDATPKKQL